MRARKSADAPTSAPSPADPVTVACPPTWNVALLPVEIETAATGRRNLLVSRTTAAELADTRSPAKAPSEAETPAEAEPPKDMPAPALNPIPAPALTKAAGGPSVMEPLTVNSAPAENRILAWPFSSAIARPPPGSPACVATDVASLPAPLGTFTASGVRDPLVSAEAV